MTDIYNPDQTKRMRRRLRQEAPLSERLLWSKLRRYRIDGLKFRRQFGVGSYVVDFYCPEARLAVEIDGETHFNECAEAKDARRQAYIESFGIAFLRFTNLDVQRNMQIVIDTIWRVAAGRIEKVRGNTANPQRSGRCPTVPPPQRGKKRPPSIPPSQGGRYRPAVEALK